MHRSSLSWRAALATTAVALGLASACSSERGAPTAASAPAAGTTATTATAASAAHAGHPTTWGPAKLTAEQLRAVARVRNATTRFHDVAFATSPDGGGYTAQYPAGCAANGDAGAQGFHYLNEGLVDATIDLLRPELVMYEPGPDGQMRLVGVDYVVPFTLWPSTAEAPTLLGVPFMRNEPLGVWALHIWAWRPNPSGMFAPWNPKVSCQHAS